MTEILASRGKKGASTSDQIVLLMQVEEKISKSLDRLFFHHTFFFKNNR